MAEENLHLKAREMVLEYANAHLPAADEGLLIDLSEIHIIHIQNVIGNWRMLITTSYPGDYYYEVTFDNFKKVVRMIAFRKWERVEEPHGE